MRFKMDETTLFMVAMQSGLMLGLIHGVNPCGHSWVVLAPFVAGDSSGWRVTRLTSAFIIGTSVGCLFIAAALGLLSVGLPDSVRYAVDIATAAIIIVLGIIMVIRPHLLHNHDHDHELGHEHEHGHEHDHGLCGHARASCGHDGEVHAGHGHASRASHHAHGVPEHPRASHGHALGCAGRGHGVSSVRAKTAWGLALIGFVNVIVPCPTLAMMYSYAIDAASVPRAMGVFGAYAVGTAIALAGVIFVIFRVTSMVRRLQQPWIETMVMRGVGVMTVGFGVWSLYMDIA